MVFRQVVGSFQILQGSGLVQGFLKEEGHKINARKLDGKYDDFFTFGMLQQDWKNQPQQLPQRAANL
jgi:hypothetical protein